MPSIDQCEVTSGNVSALPSTLEIFDTFKPVTDNGKDSDSEESFHLPLDDDDMESHSVTSNGRDKEIHNEETEDDILNKFETVPSGTPDHIDPHIEDSILEDVDNITDKEVDKQALNISLEQTESSSGLCKGSSENTKESTETTAQCDSLPSEDQNNCESEDKNNTKVEIKITYDFGEYEDSGDGEFKSIYETDEVAAEDTEVKSETLDETIEPMEVSDEPVTMSSDNQDNEKSEPSQESQQNVEETLENFEDSMEVEQEDANQDIANIIEKLEGQDAPMADIETLNGESDVNMTENCQEATLSSEKIQTDASTEKNDENISEQDTAAIEEINGDVEMADEQHEENSIENVDQSEVVPSKGCNEYELKFKESMDQRHEKLESSEGSKTQNEKLSEELQHKSIENNAELDTSKEDMEILELSSDKPLENTNAESVDSLKPNNIDEDKSTETSSNNVQDEIKNEQVDDLLSELDKTINESDKETLETTESSETKNLETLEKEPQKEQENEGNKNEEVFKVPEEVSEVVDELPAQKQEKENPDIENEKSNDKTDDESNKETLETTESSKNKNLETLEEPQKEQENEENKNEEVFKVPEEVSKVVDELPAQKQGKENPDIENEKSNDKTDDDESDLLDISMVRETEEDDACAIADALDDKEAQISERSDEEQSEKVETEQESSDVDKDNDDNDNEPIGFDDSDDSRMDGVEHDDSSNAESARGKIINISESSKDSISDCEPKKRRLTVDSSTDVSNDVTCVEASAEEHSKETEKNDDSHSILPNKSLNLDSTLVQDEEVPASADKDSSHLPITAEGDLENKGGPVEGKNDTSDISKTDKNSIKAKESSESPMEISNKEIAESLPEVTTSTEDNSVRRKSPLNKRSLSASDVKETEISAKKPKLAPKTADSAEIEKEAVDNSTKKTPENDPVQDAATVNEKVKTLTGFSKFMQCRKFTAKLSRSDLEQFCIQKICESLMLKSSEGELHQTIKKHEKTIDFLRKDLQQLSKQCKDLEIVNKKLMNELRSQNNLKKPLVPLKITRSVGLQVRLNPGNETVNQNRRRQPITGATTPQKQIVTSTTNVVVNRAKITPGSTQQPTVVRQVLQNSPQKSPLTAGQTTTNNATPTTPLLSQALQQPKPRPQAVAAKRTAAPVRKPPEASKPGNPGVIDLTDEDDRLANKTVTGNTIKIMNKTVSPGGKTLTLGKMVPGKTVANQGKQGVQKTVTVGPNKGGGLSQGIRLTPASVITSSANGSPQMVYVVPTITSNAGGTQKVAFVNFQPTNGVLSGALNGSTVSVMSNKGQTLKIVSSPMRHKHPAPLPAPPRINPDPKLKPLLPKPQLTIKKIDTGIILQWKMPYNLDLYENIASYQLYAYQETSAPPSTDMWRKVGDVKALALPMACTLTQFADKNKYYFAVRSVDVHKRIGAFSDPEEISL